MNNKNTIIGLVLIFLIFIIYSYLMTPSKEELQQQQRVADSIARVNQVRIDSAEAQAQRTRKLQEAEKEIEKENAGIVPADTVAAKSKILQDRLGQFAGSAEGRNEYYTVETDVLKLKFSTLGGKIDYVELKNYKVWDETPLVLLKNDSSDFGISFFSNNRIISTG